MRFLKIRYMQYEMHTVPFFYWIFTFRLDNKLYVEVVFNQIAPDYLEGLLLVMPGEQIDQDTVYQVKY